MHNLPIIQVIIPFCFALLVAILTLSQARIISIIAISITLCFNIYGMTQHPILYTMGGWNTPIGIEYSIDQLNQPVLCIISSILLLMLFYSKESIAVQFLNKKNGIVYSLLLLAHTGFSGIALTNDIFNLYVFLEISSLSSYALLSINQNNKALTGALDYLITGTIGASFILIGIGILFSITGSLNIKDIHTILIAHYHNRMLLLAIGCFIFGCLIKIALFPMHFWLLKAYRHSISSILIYLAPASSVIGYYILIRFIYFVCDYQILYESLNLGQILICLSVSAIILNSYLAFKSHNAKQIILYSSVAQSGYLCILLINPSNMMFNIFIMTLLTDICTKMSFFMFLDIDEQKQDVSNNAKSHTILSLSIILTILTSAGIPLTIGFVNKANILSLLIKDQMYIAFLCVIIISILSLEYHYKLLKMLLNIKSAKIKFSIIIPNILSFLIFILYQFKFLENLA